MAVTNLKKKKMFTWVPPNCTATHKFTVERKDGTVDDITDIAHMIKISDAVTDSIGSFTFELWNPNEFYTNVWTGNEIVRFYMDYDSTATTLRFRGRIEKPLYRQNKVRCSGRSESVKWMDIKVTRTFTDIECSLILKALIDAYNPGDFTYNNVSATTKTYTANWSEKPFFECVKELCDASGFEFYFDANLDAYFFQSGTKYNLDEGVVHDHNLLEVGEFGKDLQQIKNRVTVYGAEIDGVQVIYTAESDDVDYGVNSDLGIRAEIINDDNVTTYNQAVDLADAYLDKFINPPVIGEVTALTLLASIQPGDTIALSSPLDGLAPGYYQTSEYTHNIDFNGQINTIISVQKEPRKIYHIMKTLMENQNKQNQTSTNPHEMKYSYLFRFDTDEGTHSGTNISNGILTGIGTWISPLRVESSNITECYLILNGTDIVNADVKVSCNNGVSYQDISNNEKIVMSSSTGKNLLIKVTISSTNTEIQSLNLMYKT
jgi:hypothetical protein